MKPLDIHTIFTIVGVIYFVLPAITWFTLARKELDSIHLYCLGGLFTGIGIIFFSYSKGGTYYFPYILVSSAFMMAGHLLRIQSFRLDLNIPFPLKRLFQVLLFSILMNEFIEYGLNNPSLRAQFNALLSGVSIFYLAFLAWEIAEKEKSKNARAISVVYSLVSIAFLFRFYFLYQGQPQEIESILMNGESAYFIAGSGLLSSLIGHFSYVGLALDRAMRKELTIKIAQIQSEENHLMKEQIAQLDRQRSLGQMSASLGHELNQPLTAILTNAQLGIQGIAKQQFQQHDLIDILEKIIRNTRRTSQIIERIRGFIQPQKIHKKCVNLNDIIVDTLELIEYEIKKNQIEIIQLKQKDFIFILGDSIQLSQVILNILRNAIQAKKSDQPLSISLRSSLELPYVVLKIQDSGEGFSEEALRQAGNPFFTTKSMGLGMGLSISRAIVEQHQGLLMFSNTPEGGALIEVKLPALTTKEMIECHPQKSSNLSP